MTNITGVPAFGGGGVAFRQPPDPPQPAVPAISETSLNGAATYTKGNDLPGQTGTEQSYPLPPAVDEDSDSVPSRKKEVADQATPPEDILTGPTPAFQASVLEVELDLRNALAEIAAKRTQAADEAAILPAEQASEEAPANDTSARDTPVDTAPSDMDSEGTAHPAPQSTANDPGAHMPLDE